MKIPKTTPEKPYIEFMFTKTGNIELSITPHFWGGKNRRFISSKGEGNSCLPEHLDSYITAFKKKKSKEVRAEIVELQKKLSKLKQIKV